MKFDGIDFRRNRNYGFRNAKEGDVRLDGTPVRDNEVVFVRIKDCEINEGVHNGRVFRTYNPENAPQAVKLDYTLTCMGYGPWKKRVVDGRKNVPGLGFMFKGDEYLECQVFLAHDGRVYTANRKKRVTREERIEDAARAVVKTHETFMFGKLEAMEEAIDKLKEALERR